MFYKIRNNIIWRKEKGFLLILEPKTKRLLIGNRKNSKSVFQEGIIEKVRNNEKFISFLIKNKIIKPTHQKPSDNLLYHSLNFISAPLYVTVQVTNRCNLRCIHCHRISKNTQDINFEIFKKLIDDLRKLNVFSINISGGEPLLVKKIAKMVRYITSTGMNCTMSTNGTLITEKLVKQISRTKLSYVQISLDSCNSAVHDKVRGYKSAFIKTVKNINYLKRLV